MIFGLNSFGFAQIPLGTEAAFVSFLFEIELT